jgi:hypothetical protein
MVQQQVAGLTQRGEVATLTAAVGVHRPGGAPERLPDFVFTGIVGETQQSPCGARRRAEGRPRHGKVPGGSIAVGSSAGGKALGRSAMSSTNRSTGSTMPTARAAAMTSASTSDTVES